MALFVIFATVMALAIAVAIAMIGNSSGNAEVEKEEAKSFLITSPIAGINKNGCEKKHIGGFVGKLVPEPDNEFDPNAIKVVHEDGTLLGYIPAKETSTIRSYLGEKFKKYTIVGAIKFVKDKDYDPEDEDADPDDFFVGRIYIDSDKL